MTTIAYAEVNVQDVSFRLLLKGFEQALMKVLERILTRRRKHIL